uniref:Putative cadherin n=1 Tax=Schistosoma mansoni TaxID=6183 RepID=A0A3Q0KTJ1_SCHMA
MNYLYSHYYQLKLILWIFYWVLLLSGKCLAVDEIELRLRMREEIAPSTRIGSVISSLPVNLRSQMHFLTDSTFFTVTPTTGEIRVGRLIDRERLCPEFKLCCGVITCELKASIFVTNKAAGEFAASVLLKVEIQDQNDNRPTFSAQSQTVTLSEATTVGTLISINAATDADIDPENQIQRYTLVEHTGTFKLDLSGLPTVRLELLRPLDREQVSEYKASLEACDPGACTRQTLEIQILDENDNSPRLANTRFNKRLIENIPVGTVVLQLNATDIDSGERGRVMYSFHGNIDSDLTETFELVRDTGEIKLRRPLAANIRDSYEFKVIACDAVNRACSGNENSTADITFTVEDVNNFPPSIHAVAAGAALVTSSSDQNKVGESKTGESDHNSFNEPKPGDELSILENSPPSQIAVLTVRDDDTGDNSKVSCSLNDTNSNILSNGEKTTQNFILTPSTPGIYSLRTAKVFDYESESTIRTTVVCHDYGKPQQLTSARVITVQIIDVNEFQPEFSRRVYVSGVPENAPPGMDILTTTALDRDRAAVLSYKFAPSSTLSFSEGEKDSHKSDSIQIDDEVNKHFIIESQTGIIRTSQIPLDREKIGSVTLVVLVTDSVSPPIFTATTTVSIEILDENDNAPVFTNPPVRSSEAPQGDNEKFAFTIMENAPRFTQLSQRLEAKDPDQGDNGRVQFSLLATYALTKSSRRNQFIGSSPNMLTSFEHFIDRPGSDLNSEAGMTRHVVDQPIFRITSNGVIETLVELDRETVPVYILKIGVRDRGAQPLASTTMLRVNVQDANDNAPVWVFPTPVDRTINLTTGMKPGSLAGRLRAEDADSFEAGKVEYLFLGPRGETIEGVTLEEGLLNVLNPPKPGLTKTVKPGQKLSSNSDDLKGYRAGPLYLNGTTGEIWVAQALTSGTINLHLRAEDQGTPRSHTDAWLTINVFIDPSEGIGFLSFGGDGTLNITIILAMITVTAIISLFLIVGIVCVRRRPTRYTLARNVTGTDGGVSPGNAATTFSMDVAKENMSTNINSGWSSPVATYGANHFIPGQANGGNSIIEDGQMFTALYGHGGVMGYGAVMSPSDTASLIYVPQAQTTPNIIGSLGGSMTPVPVDLTTTSPDYPSRNHMHTFGTLTRTRGSVGQSVFAAPPGCAIAYEPHLDADSGDSGRGPSEEGNQFLLSDNYRNGMNIPGQHGTYQYNTYSGYRPSSRIGYYRNPSLDNTGSLTKIHSIACQNPTPGGSCACYIVSDNTIIQPVAQYGNNNGPGIAYHPEHASPQKIMPLTLEQQQMEHSRGEHSLPPIPPPRSPQMPSSTVTLRKNCTTNIPSGLSKYNESPTKVNSRASGLYPHSENSHELIHSNNNFDHNGFNQPDDQSSNIIQTPLRIDLRGQSTTDFNTSENNYDTASKQHRLVRNGLGIGLPPLASNYALNQPVNIQPKQKSNPLSNPELQLTV